MMVGLETTDEKTLEIYKKVSTNMDEARTAYFAFLLAGYNPVLKEHGVKEGDIPHLLNVIALAFYDLDDSRAEELIDLCVDLCLTHRASDITVDMLEDKWRQE
jgi:hypothetical protein